MGTVTKSREQVKADLVRTGTTIRGWAEKHGFTVSTVRHVMSGKSLNQYGDSHKVAVLLGMKDGIILDD